MLEFASNEQIDKEKADRALKPNGPVMSSLASHARTVWEANKRGKMQIEERLFKCQRQRKGQYDPGDAQTIRDVGGSDIFMMLTAIKCRSIESAIIDAMLPTGERPFAVEPTPVPDFGEKHEDAVRQRVSQEVYMAVKDGHVIDRAAMQARIEEVRELLRDEMKQDAEEKAERQEDLIDDVFVEGGFYDELKKFIKDFATFPSAIIKGPEVRNRQMLVWGEDGMPEPGRKLLREFYRVSPYDAYPSPGARNANDGAFCERLRLRRKDLVDCLGVPGFYDAELSTVLVEYAQGQLSHWLWTDEERARLENRPNEQDDPSALIDVVEVWDSVPGRKLIEWGYDKKKIKDPKIDVEIRLWLIGSYVVMARFNPHPLGKRPYYTASFEEINDAFWGTSPPEIMRDCQRVCNATARSAVDNIGIAGGPQIEVYKKRIDGTETDPEDIYPMKVWQTKESLVNTSGNNPAVRFFQPELIADRLMNIFDKFYLQAGEQIGVPAYEHGSTNTKGAGETASGLNMLLNQASKVMKDAIRHIDDGVIAKAVKEVWLHVVLYDEPEEAGDIKVVARASEYMLVYERLQLLRRDWLAATANPIDMQIIGIEGRAEVLREQARQLKMPVDHILPSRKEIMRLKEENEMRQEEMAAMQGEEVAA